MTLKNLFKSLLLLPLTLALPACDDIDEADRWQPASDITVKKNVLIEDFTGQRCPNCPQAHEVMADIQQKLGAGHIIAVAIHGGSLALTDNGNSPVALANEESNALTAQFGVENWPMGFVDRIGSLTAPTAWTSQAVERCQAEPGVEITLDNITFDEATRTLGLNVNTKALTDIDGTLHVWLTESNITAPQLNGGTMDREYVHNHVYRAALNTPEGTPLKLTEDNSQSTACSYTLARTYWKAENMAIVAFVKTADGVAQVIEQKLLNN